MRTSGPNDTHKSSSGPETLDWFYALMARTAEVRRRLVRDCLAGIAADRDLVDRLRESLNLLCGITAEAHTASLLVDGKTRIDVDLAYEVEELRRDLLFFEQGEQALLSDLGRIHPTLSDDIDAGVRALIPHRIHAFITDRDGTVNNYCGRYRSSVQSAYNAVFLSRFARTCDHAILLTSAPLHGAGLAEVVTSPSHLFTLAGSKGREYVHTDGRQGGAALDPQQEAMLALLNRRIEKLLAHPSYAKFSLIGSGFQKKFGQTTLARQDIGNSIDPGESLSLLTPIHAIIRDIDPREEYLRIEDTGRDIEIMLTVRDNDSGFRDFDKGDGLRFLAGQLGIDLSTGTNLVCGDTASDLPMLRAAMDASQDTKTVFVTTDPRLREQVRGSHPAPVLVGTPDALVLILHELSRAAGENQGECCCDD